MDRTLRTPAYIASLAPKDIGDARRLIARVPPAATAIEYRLDLSDPSIDAGALLALDPRTAIVTYRTLREGGRFDGSIDEYRGLVGRAYAAGATVDVELASGVLTDAAALPDRERVIVSHHSLFALPEDWESLLSAMRATRARAVKLVAGSADLAGSLRIASLQERHADGRTSIFPMGPASQAGRVLSALAGGGVDLWPGRSRDGGGPGAADGPARDLRSRPAEDARGDVRSGGWQPGAIALTVPLQHALSKRGTPHLYVPLPVADFDREAPQNIVSQPPIRGLAVTQPWKLAAARAGRPSEDVRKIGAANTLFLDRGRWRAENTDVDGVFDPLADHGTGEGRSAVIVGAGGAARAAIVACRRLGYEVSVAARRDAEADRLAEAFGVDSMAWDDLASSEADLYLNATPVGWKDDDPPAIPRAVFEARPVVFDCVYRRDGVPTATIRLARAAGCPTVEGLAMLAAQAVRQAQCFGVEGVTLSEVTEILQRGVAR